MRHVSGGGFGYDEKRWGFQPSSSSSSSSQLGTRRKFSSDISSVRNASNSIVVVGSGVAGCATALLAANEYNINVDLVCAGSQMVDCNSYWAQGGIIYRNYNPEARDSAESLARDILKAGDGGDGMGLCDREAVLKVAKEGPSRVRQFLLDAQNENYANVPFNRDDEGKLLYCLEASHSAPRILYWADKTGKAISTHLTEAVLRNPRINVRNNRVVLDLVRDGDRVVGVRSLDTESCEQSNLYSELGVVLASGGLGGIYSHSTNPNGFNALGSSVALARRADAQVSDLEYIQFHPTALNLPGQKPFLLTEALRGCGAYLVDDYGKRFMFDFHEDAELAPRDVVARAVYSTAQTGSNVYLDISHKGSEFVQNRFPSIHEYLISNTGLDISSEQIPITPAAHYTCGGIRTDLNARTSVQGLFAAGESARSGLHGGNRLASTSLLEGLVFGASAAEYIGEKFNNSSTSPIPSSNEEKLEADDVNLSEAVVMHHGKKAQDIITQVRRTMWEEVGIVRTPEGLNSAQTNLRRLNDEAEMLFSEVKTSLAVIAARDASLAGLTVSESAAANNVSAGAHCVVDDEMDMVEGIERVAM